MDALWTADIDHDGSTAGWSPEFVCSSCTPSYYRRFA
ncbi:hypothetical protein C497_04020 [Halalkalicoccus jeotgali B3]|uniref:Uncharacterized protein n=1 Tax=Halalkalicoccus jeotgali (strain DSM 18796 / CECT 7217 / JCM 14584 / KCTC 4019 / B3) TaxID=795797 RepID=D8JA00_HALJB|nr:hypothetical protein HacjB3_05655 [Halalkalicoccus jeotgali B3]ELY40094.1 hypothetical protein C497_04020 [Halalkalicoccus jeotgali B3]